jgi:hypothetical protein
MSDHALISPSALSRIIACPGSVRLSKDLPDTTSAAAEEGTAAHALFESLLTGARKRVPKGTDPEMARHIRDAVQWVQAKASLTMDDPQLYCEIRVNPGDALDADPELCWGTADVVLFNDRDFWVIDLKYGFGEVKAKDNPQLLAYAIGALHKFGDKGQALHLAILQPRTGGDIADTWDPEDHDVDNFADTLDATIELATSPDAPLVPSEDACRWCRAAAICPALRKEALEPFQNLDEPTIPALGTDALADLLNRSKLLSALLSAVQDEALRRALSGQTLPGWKLVESVTRRAWVRDYGALLNELKLAGLPVDKLAPPTLVTPAQAEKLVAKTDLPILNGFIIKPRGKPTLAPVTDKRPTLAKSDFEALD